MRTAKVLAALIVLFSCTPDCPQNEQQWEDLLHRTAKHSITYVQIHGDSLAIMWDGKEFNETLPIEKKISSESINDAFEEKPSITDTVINEIPFSIIGSTKGSKLLYSDQWGIVEAFINEPSGKLLGENIKTGMSKEDFIRLYFKEYSSCFDAVNAVIFPYGMNDNGITYSFTGDKLTSIHFINYPD